MSKQTALQWYIQQRYILDCQEIGMDEYEDEKMLLAEQALQMEREQIIKANRDGVDMIIDQTPFITGKEYYEQTYGGQDE